MGVQGLWTVVQPCARPTNLATLNHKRLAIDASIWIYQFLKAVRDQDGNVLHNSHVVGFFRRICKLLWHGIKPVFVFDGGAPALKRATLQARRQRREFRREDAARTAGKLLALQMHRLAQEQERKRKRRAQPDQEEQEDLPPMEDIVYADELGMSKQDRQRNRQERFHKQDAYHLPDLHTDIEAMAKPDDPRIMSLEELEEYAQQFHNGEDINLYDFSKIDFDGDFFKSLPPADRYNILNAARIRSRLRMGLSKEQLDGMFPDRMAFSRFQIERVRERNRLTQRLMHEIGMTGTDLTLGVNRIVGDRNREYILVKNEGAEGGWALGVVSRDKDTGTSHKPIDVDALEFRYQSRDNDEEDDWEDVDFEDVPIEGLNRLPKPKDDAEESLFVDHNDEAVLWDDAEALQDDEEEEAVQQAIALSLKNQHGLSDQADDGADLDRAMALSLEHQQATSHQAHVEDQTPDQAPPEWEQKAVEAPGPIAGIPGWGVAHLVNNRSTAAVPRRRRRRSSDTSDSDVDLQSALAAARKKQPRPQPVKPPAPAPANPNGRNPFGGPLPFEKLDWRKAFGGTLATAAASKPKPPPPPPPQPPPPQKAEVADLEPVSDDEAGGFLREEESAQEKATSGKSKDDKPLPLPPWLTDTTDIRESVRKQQELERQMGQEDAEEEDVLRRQDDGVIEIESSSGDSSDVEILDAPPAPIQKPAIGEMPGASLPSLEDNRATSVPGPSTRDSEPAKGLWGVGAATSLGTAAPDEAQNKASEDPVSESEDGMEFEDVVLPSGLDALAGAIGEPTQDVYTEEEAAEAARIEAELFGNSSPAPDQTRPDGGQAPGEDSVDPIAPAPEGFDDFSDPEDEELMVQLAQEAEEHARFASQLNSKSLRENKEAYEKELRQLREQQKKDRRDADEVTQVMVAECQTLLTLFGIPYITAPMEAEAQCAELVRLGLVDGIVTDDSDTFLFGGTHVYKNMFSTNKYVECYLAEDLEAELSLSREQLIALAQLLGSDYTEGLAGVGPVTALELLAEFPGADGLERFRDWWLDVQQRGRSKEADARSPFRRKFRKAHATKLFLPPGFPSPAVADAYLRPVVDSSPEPFQWGVPDLDGLRRFLIGTVGWSQERTDEVLVPVIRDMNRREMEGTQSNITRFFGGAFAPREKGKGASKRMAEAVSRLRARAAGGGGGEGGELGSGEMPVAPPPVPKPKAGRKRKARVAVRDEEIEQEEEEEGNGGEDGMEGDGGVEEEDGGDHGKGKRRRNGRAAGKGRKAQA
ncbi:hypothetical protein VTJ83DRAFT_2367 [Remersonia thermophila]|uniref:Uncharacterized protein n=1 Tax=Remersonia thermophila TaxID=72144 RepID=A0ABR4DIJ5_9PEZI